MRKLLLFLCLALALSTQLRAETITLLAEDDWYPYTGKLASGQVEGISVDLLRAAFEAVGVDVEFDVIPYDRAMAKVREGKGLAAFNTPREPGIEKFYAWPAQPLFQAKSLYFAKTTFDRQISKVQDLDGLKVALVQGYGYGDEIDNDTRIDKILSSSDKVGIRKTLADRADVVVVYDMVAKDLLKKMKVTDQLKVVGEASVTDIYLAFSRTFPDSERIRTLFDQGFAEIRKNGRYEEIMQEWNARFE